MVGLTGADRPSRRTHACESEQCRERDWRREQSHEPRLAGNPQDAGLCARHRAGGANLSLSAVQHPVWIDEADAAGRRLPVRGQVCLWLQPERSTAQVRAYAHHDQPLLAFDPVLVACRIDHERAVAVCPRPRRSRDERQAAPSRAFGSRTCMCRTVGHGYPRRPHSSRRSTWAAGSAASHAVPNP
jgi:hypothetical protein